MSQFEKRAAALPPAKASYLPHGARDIGSLNDGDGAHAVLEARISTESLVIDAVTITPQPIASADAGAQRYIA
jgi:hypothetical protein